MRSLRDLGAIGDGVADDTAAFVRANDEGVVELCLPPGVYRITHGLQMREGASWVGSGGQGATKIVNESNDDAIAMSSCSNLSNLSIQGGSRGVHVVEGFSQVIERVRVNGTTGPCLEFAHNHGGGARVTGFEGTTVGGAAALRLTDSTASPKFLRDLWLSGGVIDIAGGGNGLVISGFYIRNFITDDKTALAHISNGRVASIHDTTTLSGSDCEMTGVAFSGPVVLAKAQGWLFDACTFGAGIAEDGQTSRYNHFEEQAHAFAPAWWQDVAQQPDIADGLLTGVQRRSGRSCHLQMRLVAGRNTKFGNDASAYRFALPVKASPMFDQRGHPASVTINGKNYTTWATIGAGESSFTLGYGSGAVRDGVPDAWLPGSTIDIAMEYQVG